MKYSSKVQVALVHILQVYLSSLFIPPEQHRPEITATQTASGSLTVLNSDAWTTQLDLHPATNVSRLYFPFKKTEMEFT